MFNIKWTSNLMEQLGVHCSGKRPSGLVLSNGEVEAFETEKDAEEKIKELKKTASKSITFEVVPA